MANIKSAAPDDLLRCLGFLTAFHGKAKSSDALIAGLAYDGQGLSDTLFIEAAERIGLKTSIATGRAVRDILPAVLPCIVILKDGSPAVLLEKGEGIVTLWKPETEKRHEETLPDFAKLFSGKVILVKPKAFFIDRELLDTENPALHWFRGAIRENRDVYLRVIIASLLINVFALVSPVYIMNIYDRVIPNSALETGWALSLGALIVFVVDFIIRTLRGYFTDYAGRRIDVQVTRRVFDQVSLEI